MTNKNNTVDECKRCIAKNIKHEHKGKHLGAYCQSCGAWQKWVRQYEYESDDVEMTMIDKLAMNQHQNFYVAVIKNVMSNNDFCGNYGITKEEEQERFVEKCYEWLNI